MGQVYLARTPAGRQVVVKVIRPELTDDPRFRARFAREAEMAKKVGGFHTAQVVDSDPEADPPWIATAFVPGPSLEQAVRENGPLQEQELITLALGLAEGLEAIHDHDLVHRDLKPANILLAEDGPRIIDFGIARPMDATGMTGTGTVLGTLAYMSPEQAQGEPVGPASDMFALGTVLTFAATGKNPFAADTMGAIVFRVISAAPEVEGFPDRFQPLIAACWNHDPNLRPTPGELIAALEEVDTEADLPSKRAEGGHPVSPVAPTRLEEQRPEPELQERTVPDPSSGARLSVFRRRPLVAAMSTVLLAGLVSWAMPSVRGTPSELKADVVVDLHEGEEKAYEGSEKTNTQVTGMEVDPGNTRLVTKDEFSLDRGWFKTDISRSYLRLWDMTTGEKLTEYRLGKDSPGQKVLFGADGAVLRAEVVDGQVRLHDFESHERLHSLGSEHDSLRYVTFNDEGSTLLTRTVDDEILEWDTETGELLATRPGEKDAIPEGTPSPDGTIVANEHSGKFDLQDAASGELIATLDGADAELVSFAFNPDGTIFATGGDDERTRLWDTGTGELVATHTTYEDTFFTRNFTSPVEVGAVTFSPDGSTLATGRSDGDIHLWDVESGDHTFTLTGHEGEIQHMAFGVDGKTLFAGGDGSMLRMWKLA